MQHSTWMESERGNQHKASPLPTVLILPCFPESTFCYEKLGELKISLWVKKCGYRSPPWHLCHHPLSFPWLIGSPLLYGVSLMPQRNERIKKKYASVSAEKVIKLWLLPSKELACKEVFSCFNVFLFFPLRLFFSIDLGTLGREPAIYATEIPG